MKLVSHAHSILFVSALLALPSQEVTSALLVICLVVAPLMQEVALVAVVVECEVACVYLTTMKLT